MTYHEPGTQVTADKFGLPKLPLYQDAGKPEEDNRDHSRAPLISGGTVTGKAFQTDSIDPRITMDSTGLRAHRTDGRETMKLDVTSGTISLFADTVNNGILTWVTATGAQIAAIAALDSGGGSGQLALSAAGASASIDISTNVGGAGWSDLALSSQSASMVTHNAALTATASIGLAGVGRVTLSGLIAGGTSDVVAVQDGHIITNDASSTEKHLFCSLATFTCTFGVRWTAAAAGNGHGARTQYRKMRGSTAGVTVTPGAFTLTTVIVNTNATGPAIGSIRAESAELTMTSTAAGTVVYGVAATAS